MQTFEHKRIRDLGDILTDTFQYVRVYYKSLLKGLFFFVAPLYLIQAFLMEGYASELFASILNPSNTQDLGELFGWRYFTSMGITLLSYAVLSLVTFNHLYFTEEGEEPITTDLLEDSGILILRFLGLYVVMMFILFFSALFFIIPAIFLGIRLSLASSVIVLEKRGVFESLGRSWELTQNYWWATFTLFFIMYIIILFSSYVLILPTTLVSIFLTDSGTINDPQGYLSLFTIFSAISTAVSSLFVSLFHISFALQYYNLVERKEGGSLRAKIEGLVD